MIHADPKAEDAILASISVEPEVLDVLEALDPLEFARPGNGCIFGAMRRLHAAGKPVDPIHLRAELERMGDLDRAGGDERLGAILEVIPNVDAVESYAARVRELAAVRRVLARAKRILALEAGPIEDVPGMLAAAARDMAEAAADPHAETKLQPIGDVLPEVEQSMRERQERRGVAGITSGLAAVDTVITGMEGGWFIVIGGRPGMGKSALAQRTARVVAEQHGPVAIFSLEMKRSDWVRRMALAEASIDGRKMRLGTLSDSDWDRFRDAQRRLSRLPIFIDDTPGLTPHQLRSRARRMKAKHGLALVVVDYLQLMRPPAELKQDREEAGHAEVSRSLKELAKEVDVPVVALAQLNRDVEKTQGKDKRPFVHHLRNSGQIEQDADVIAFVYRDAVYNPGADSTAAEVIVRKHRHGDTGTAKVRFLRHYTRFEDFDASADPRGQRALPGTSAQRRQPRTEPWHDQRHAAGGNEWAD